MQGPYQDRELVLQVLDTDDGPYDDRVGEVTNTGGSQKKFMIESAAYKAWITKLSRPWFRKILVLVKSRF